MKKIAVAISGSSGAIYAKLLLDKLAELPEEKYEIAVVMSENARLNWELEIGDKSYDWYEFKMYEKNDFFAPFASGSSLYKCLIVCPCSMGMLARIAQGISNDLISRAADVMLKERRKLILVPRETPFNLIHLENMTRLTRAGAIICPAIPSFYSKPQNTKALLTTVVDRVLQLAGLEVDAFRWGS